MTSRLELRSEVVGQRGERWLLRVKRGQQHVDARTVRRRELAEVARACEAKPVVGIVIVRIPVRRSHFDYAALGHTVGRGCTRDGRIVGGDFRRLGRCGLNGRDRRAPSQSPSPRLERDQPKQFSSCVFSRCLFSIAFGARWICGRRVSQRGCVHRDARSLAGRIGLCPRVLPPETRRP